VDLKVSRKESRLQPSETVEVLVSNVFDIYPVYDSVDPNLIVDVEMLDDERTELLDRAMFAAVKQRGADPLEVGSGVQWAEAVLGEVTVPVVMTQVQKEVQAEGPGVAVGFSTFTGPNGKEFFQFDIKLTNAV
jgi:hypothetical protein